MGPSALAVFSHWPTLQAENERIAYEHLLGYHRQTGEVVVPAAKIDLGFTTTEDGQVKPRRVYRHQRPKFAKMLLEQLGRIGISVQYDHKVVEYYENAKTGKGGVKLENGQTIEADLVIAADGVGTRSHRLISGRELRARGSGYAIYRSAYPIEHAMKDPLVAERWKFPPDGSPSVFELWAGY